MSLEDAQKTINAFGSVFQWGSGLLGKSAIVTAIMEVGIFAAAWTVHGDSAKITLVCLGVGSFFCWYIPFLKFCEKHPADALLEGHHWAAHQQIMAAKGQPSIVVGAAMQPSENYPPASNIVRHDGDSPS